MQSVNSKTRFTQAAITMQQICYSYFSTFVALYGRSRHAVSVFPTNNNNSNNKNDINNISNNHKTQKAAQRADCLLLVLQQ